MPNSLGKTTTVNCLCGHTWVVKRFLHHEMSDNWYDNDQKKCWSSHGLASGGLDLCVTSTICFWPKVSTSIVLMVFWYIHDPLAPILLLITLYHVLNSWGCVWNQDYVVERPIKRANLSILPHGRVPVRGGWRNHPHNAFLCYDLGYISYGLLPSVF